ADAGAEIVALGKRRRPRDVDAHPGRDARRARRWWGVEQRQLDDGRTVADAGSSALLAVDRCAMPIDHGAERKRSGARIAQFIPRLLRSRHRRPEPLEAEDEPVEHAIVTLVHLKAAADLEAREAMQREPAAIVDGERVCLVSLGHQELVTL